MRAKSFSARPSLSSSPRLERCALIGFKFFIALFLFRATPVRSQTSPATLPDLNLSTAGSLSVVAVQDDGKVIVAGFFNSVNDVPRTNIARLNPNGSVDLTWAPSINNSVYCVAVSGTNIYVGGNFINVNGPSRNGLARLSSVDGSLDATWNPGPNINMVNAISVVGTNVYVAGNFTTIGGQTRNRIARLSTSGTGQADPAWNPDADGEVQQLLINGSDIFAAGLFSSIGGQSRNGLAKLSLSGAADSIWNPSPLQWSLRTMKSLVVENTNLYVAGFFTNIGGFPRTGLAKVSTTGTGAVDSNWNPPISVTTTFAGSVNTLAVTNNALFVGFGSNIGGAAKVDAEGTGTVNTNWQVASDAGFNVLALTPSGVFGGGSFHLCNGVVSLSIVKLDLLAGTRDSGFAAQVQRSGQVNAIARQADGKVIVGGDFFFVGGLPRQHLARVNADGTFDSLWSPDPDGIVYSLAVTGTNIFVGGLFNKIGGLNRTNLAKLSTIGSDAADTNWDAGLTNGFVRTLATDGANLFVGGGFNRIGGQTRQYVAKLNISTTLADPVWQSSPDQPPYYLLLDNTNLFIGGGFRTVKGVTRRGVAKVSALGSGDVDASWNAGIVDTQTFPQPAQALALSGTNLFIAGSFTNIGGQSRMGLAKASTLATGAVDPVWNPFVNATSANASALALDETGTNLFVGGSYFVSGTNVQSTILRRLLRVGVAGTNGPDLSFNPMINLQPFVFIASGRDIYAGGFYNASGGVRHAGFAFLPVADAPQLIQDTPTNFFILRNAEDGQEVTHFRVTGISGGTLYRSDGVTMINPNEFLTVADGAAGLSFVPGGSITAVSSLNNTTNGLGKNASVLTMSTNPNPIFKFSATTYSVREGQGNIVILVRKFGNGAATVDYATSDLTATGNVDYQTRTGTLNFSAADKFKNIIITVADDLQAEGDEQFSITLSNAVSAVISGPATSVVTISDNDLSGLSDSLTTPVLPTTPPNSSGALTVSLQPPNANGQWRLLGQINWHDGGVVEFGLVSGNYGIEFRPVSGYREPQAVTVPITAGVTNQFTFFYAAVTNLDAGNLSVVIEPNDVATASDPNLRGQWRRQGATNWLNSEDVIPNLNAGNYALEFKTIPGRVTPPIQLIAVGANATYGTVATYAFGVVPGAIAPGVVPFDTATTNTPYLYNGQIQTSIGFGSGFVVKQRVALTAAHVLFDDVQLSYVTSIRWFFQRYRDQLEPVPQIPRGWYVFNGYAARRQLDDSPGVSTSESQNLDAAALYFLEDAGRGGYGGYLSTDADANEYLLSANQKFLAGYPLDGIADADKGKLHATTPTNLTFIHLYTSVFSTTNLQSFPGNSGGPLYVQTGVNQYFPAAIYLGGSGETLVRAINSEVVDLINRAEVSGNGGGNSTGGGALLLSPGTTTPPTGSGLLIVSLTPSNAIHSRPGWRIMGLTDTNYFEETARTTVAVIGGGNYPIEFKPIVGFMTPSNRTVTVAVGGLVTIQGDYVGIRPQLGLNRTNGLILGGGIGATYRVEFKTNLTTQTTWTPLTSFTLSTSSLLLSNTRPATNGNRFYRAVLVP